MKMNPTSNATANRARRHPMSLSCGCTEQEHTKNMPSFSLNIPTPVGETPKLFLEWVKGHLVTKSYAGYKQVEDIIRYLCWSHIRRYYVEVILLDKGYELSGSKGSVGCENCNRLFKIEQELSGLSPEDRLILRQKLSNDVLDEFWYWIEKISEIMTTNNKLQEALIYQQNQWAYLVNFLLNLRVTISNNHAIRPFEAHRRNQMFADTTQGCSIKCNCLFYYGIAKSE